MKRSLAACVSAALIALGLTAAPAYAQAPVKIGVLTPLSPPEDINARGGVLGGRKIELVIEDDSGTPEKGLAAFRKLATQDHVSAVIGQYHSSVTLAVQALARHLHAEVRVALLDRNEKTRDGLLGEGTHLPEGLKRLRAETAAELDALIPSILDKAFKGEL